MNIEEKIARMTDEQIERFKDSFLDFDCDEIDCRYCLFHSDVDRCMIVRVFDEYTARKTAE